MSQLTFMDDKTALFGPSKTADITPINDARVNEHILKTNIETSEMFSAIIENSATELEVLTEITANTAESVDLGYKANDQLKIMRNNMIAMSQTIAALADGQIKTNEVLQKQAEILQKLLTSNERSTEATELLVEDLKEVGKDVKEVGKDVKEVGKDVKVIGMDVKNIQDGIHTLSEITKNGFNDLKDKIFAANREMQKGCLPMDFSSIESTFNAIMHCIYLFMMFIVSIFNIVKDYYFMMRERILSFVDTILGPFAPLGVHLDKCFRLFWHSCEFCFKSTYKNKCI